MVLIVHLHHLAFWPTFSNLGNVCGDNGVSVHPYAHPQTVEGAQTPHIGMTWMWDAF